MGCAGHEHDGHAAAVGRRRPHDHVVGHARHAPRQHARHAPRPRRHGRCRQRAARGDVGGRRGVARLGAQPLRLGPREARRGGCGQAAGDARHVQLSAPRTTDGTCQLPAAAGCHDRGAGHVCGSVALGVTPCGRLRVAGQPRRVCCVGDNERVGSPRATSRRHGSLRPRRGVCRLPVASWGRGQGAFCCTTVLVLRLEQRACIVGGQRE
mmetsp:Transcript_65443/g.154596  ORF Transcript_65443/g.154596 Transcript_65443/m.154596 type:complete len:210 (+) Transcript_65443:1012-1641(+)